MNAGAMNNGRLWVGTSGYSYKEWKGAFYPEKLPAKRYLEFYSERLSTVEINNTFYRFPTEKLLEGWRAGTPVEFCFAVKANQGITHKGRLEGVETLAREFVERCQSLGAKLGPILFQLPPYFRRDDERLARFLVSLPQESRYAIEFRHVSWFEEPTFEALRSANVAFCVSEGDKLDSPRIATADFCYARLRKETYEAEELRSWRGWFEEQSLAGRDVFAYLKHDEAGVSPENALQLLR